MLAPGNRIVSLRVDASTLDTLAKVDVGHSFATGAGILDVSSALGD